MMRMDYTNNTGGGEPETVKDEEYDEEQEELMVDDEDEDEDCFEEEIEMDASDSSSSEVAGSPHGSSSNSSHSPSLQVESPSSRTSDSNTNSSSQPEKRHICDICGKGFSYFSILESHKRSHTGEKPFKCHFCEKRFAQKATLQVHERTHTGERPYKCRYCEKTFAQYGTKTVHEKSAHLGIRNYKCPKCDKSLSSPSALYTHKKTHGDKTFRCEFCPKTFALKNYLKLHVKQVHEQNERKHVCQYCHKGFAYAGSLQVHVRTHTGERPYTCQYCPKAFASQGNLQSHERTHTGERPYSCQFCQRTFIQKSQLTAHESTHLTNKTPHSDTSNGSSPARTTSNEPVGNFDCTLCPKRYPYASSLYAHMRKHAGEKPMEYNCNGCGKGFPQKVGLNIHFEQCEAYKSFIQLGKSSNMSSNLSNDDSDSDAEVKMYPLVRHPLPPPPTNIYQQPPPLGIPSICNLSDIKLQLPGVPMHLNHHQLAHHQQQLNFSLGLAQPQAVFPHHMPPPHAPVSNNVQTPYTPVEIPPSDFGPIAASKPPAIQSDIQSSASLSAFHTPIAKSSIHIPHQDSSILSNLLPNNNSATSLGSLSNSLLSTQILLQQLHSSDHLNYLLQQNILSLAAAVNQMPPSTPQFNMMPPQAGSTTTPVMESTPVQTTIV